MNHFLLAVFQFSALWSPLACLCVNNKCISHQRHRGWCLRSAEHKEAVFISVFVQSNTGSNSAFGDNAQPACNPFSWEICSQIRRCHRAYRASSRLLSFIWDDILIFISARLIHEGMCTGASYLPPGPVSGRRQWGRIDSSSVSFLQHLNSFLFMSVYNLSKLALSSVVMRREMWTISLEELVCEPEVDSCRHNLLLTRCCGYFFLFLLSDGRLLGCSLCRRGLGGFTPHGVDVLLSGFLAIYPAEATFFFGFLHYSHDVRWSQTSWFSPLVAGSGIGLKTFLLYCFR